MNESLSSIPDPNLKRTSLYVITVIALCALAAISVVLITILRPDKDNTSVIATLLGLFVPSIGALIAAIIQQVHLAVNSRLTELLRVTAASSKAEGVKEATEARKDLVKSPSLI